MDKLKYIKLENEDGSYSESIPLAVDSNYVDINGEILTNVINKKPYYYNSVADMKADIKLKVGDMVTTLGYFEKNDGGNGIYNITNEANTPDEGSIIALNNGLFAKLIIENNIINIKQLGAKSQDKLGTKYDIKQYIEKYLELNALYNYTLKLYIPSGVYHLSPLTISELYGFYIYGDNSFMLSNCGTNTIITTLNDNQDYLLNIGDTTKFTQNWTLKNITFSSGEYNYSNGRYKFNSRKSVNTYLTNFNNATFGKLNNIFYIHVNGGCINIGSMWEVYSNILNFRDINSVNKSIINFSEPDTILLATANQSALTFENIMFEKVLGHLINISGGTKLGNTIINNINFEDYSPSDWDNITTSTINNDNRSVIDSDETIHQAIINFEHTDGIASGPTGRIIINNILCNNMAVHYTTYNNNNYVYDRIVNNNGNYNYVGILINNVENIGMNKDIKLLYSRGSTYQYSYFKVNNCNNSNTFDFKFDVDNFTYIECNSRIKSITNPIKHYLLNNITPAYKLVNNRTTGDKFLYSDSDTLNDLNIAVKVKTTTACLGFILNSYDLTIRAKVPNEETALLYIGGNHSQTLTLAGTGNYEIYTFTVGSQFPLGDIINLNFQSANTATSCLIDYIIN